MVIDESVLCCVVLQVLRPWCHFELPASDYLSAGRRNPELPGPSGVVEPLDPAIKVVEFCSLGVRVRNSRTFFILNPTSISYEFVWAPVASPNLAMRGAQPPASPFTCLVRKGSIAGGRCEALAGMCFLLPVCSFAANLC